MIEIIPNLKIACRICFKRMVKNPPTRPILTYYDISTWRLPQLGQQKNNMFDLHPKRYAESMLTDMLNFNLGGHYQQLEQKTTSYKVGPD